MSIPYAFNPMGRNDGLPYPFRKLQYLESSGAQWINTGINAASDVTVSLQFEYTRTLGTNNVAFGARNGTTDKPFYLLWGAGEYFAARHGNRLENFRTPTAGQAVTVSCADGILAYAGRQYTVPGTDFSGGREIYLAAMNDAGTVTGLSYVRFYSVKIGGCDFVPAICPSGKSYINGNTGNTVTASTDKPGMYDKVSGRFFVNKGTGEDFHYCYNAALTVASGETLYPTNATINGRVTNNGTINFSGESVVNNTISGSGTITLAGGATLKSTTGNGVIDFTNAAASDSINAGQFTVSGLRFKGHTGASANKSVLAIKSNAPCAINNCIFENNTVSNDGGVLYKPPSNQAPLEISNCTFRNNSCTRYGGAVCSWGAVTFDHCTFSGNSTAAGRDARDLLLNIGAVIKNCTFNGEGTVGNNSIEWYALETAAMVGEIDNCSFLTDKDDIRIYAPIGSGHQITLKGTIRTKGLIHHTGESPVTVIIANGAVLDFTGHTSSGYVISMPTVTVIGTATVIDKNGNSHTISGTGTYINANGATDLTTN